jgi:hypothetical protein
MIERHGYGHKDFKVKEIRAWIRLAWKKAERRKGGRREWERAKLAKV